MAEFLCKDMAKNRRLSEALFIASAGTSSEELGNPPHRGTREKLTAHGISCKGKTAVPLLREDYPDYDLFIAMEERNARDMRRIFGGDPEGKIHTLLSFTPKGGDIADPWYTGNFDATWRDVSAGCEGLLNTLLPQRQVQAHDR